MSSDDDQTAVTPQQLADALEDLSDTKREARGELLLWLGKHGDRSVLEALERAALHDHDSWQVEGAFVDGSDFSSDYACTALRVLLQRVPPTDDDRARWSRLLHQDQGDESEEHRLASFFEYGLGQHAHELVKDAARDPAPAVHQRAAAILQRLEWHRS